MFCLSSSLAVCCILLSELVKIPELSLVVASDELCLDEQTEDRVSLS